MNPVQEDFQSELLRLRNQVADLAAANAQAAQLMAELEEAREAERILQANNAHLRWIHQLGEHRAHYLELVARNQPLDSLLDGLAELTATLIPGLAFSFLLVRQGVLRHAFSRGLPAGLAGELQQTDLSGLDVFRRAMRTRNEAVFQELTCDTGLQPLCHSLRRQGLHAVYCLPVATSTRLLGLVVIYTMSGLPPGNELQTRLREVSALFAMGMEHRSITERLTFQAHHDALTGLPNRHHFYEALQDAISESRMDGGKVAVVWGDLDRFKQINDTLGHRTADLLLQLVADRLSQVIRPHGIAARMGGDEFVMLIKDVGHASQAQEVAANILSKFQEPFGIGDEHITIAFSLGLSVFPDDADDAETLLRNADLAMYGAKHQGRNNLVSFNSEQESSALEAFQLEFHLRRALERNELVPYYQPLVSATDGSIAAFETLLRWYNPELGPVSPAQFIPVAETSGLMHDIGRWVLEQACQHAASWQKDHPGVRVAVNVSATQLARGDFHEVAAEALRKSGLDPHLLELELTESAIIGLADYQRHTGKLRELGVSLAIDDFGTGYSSLSYLHKLHVDKLKIDRSFVASLGIEEASTRLAETIVAMAKSLRLDVVAEGIENEEQMRWLTEIGCDLLQGYFLYKPMPFEEACEALQSRPLPVQPALR